jgi:hypothetical protein
MLIRFKSEAGGFTMFGDVALKLLRMTGHSGTVPGAIGADDMPEALARLEEQVRIQVQSDEAAGDGSDDTKEADEATPSVGLSQRAFPMIELMRRAVDEQCALQWDEAASF